MARAPFVYKFQRNSFTWPWEFWRAKRVLGLQYIINYCIIIIIIIIIINVCYN